jgi:hypothetical protein
MAQFLIWIIAAVPPAPTFFQSIMSDWWNLSDVQRLKETEARTRPT